MLTKFTDENGCEILVNPDHIVCIETVDGKASLSLVNGRIIYFSEAPSEIKTIVDDAKATSLIEAAEIVKP